MANIYTRKDGLRVAEIEYGWGMEREAIEFPLDLAISGLFICQYLLEKGNKKLERVINIPELLSVYTYCMDTIESGKKGEVNYIYSEFWEELMQNLKRYAELYLKENEQTIG